ncbi:MAG: diguanylate cyclase [Gammaproteobacteria bacterium]|nr:diguanylate cyclase [Gammaproteobacteria bacterium]
MEDITPDAPATAQEYNTRILIVDDNESIHEDFRKVLLQEKNENHAALDELEAELFGEDSSEAALPSTENDLEYRVDSAFQGEEALEMVNKAEAEGQPYSLIFMDVRMPPGWDGIETISHIWIDHPYLEMVLCTAYSDYTWDDIVAKLGCTDKLLFLRKPFDAVAVQQMALSLVKKWNLGNQARSHVKNLEREVQERTVQLRELLQELEEKNAVLASSNDELKHTSLHDYLTSLPNRILFHDRLEQAIKLASRNDGQFAVALMDLNGFKDINDQRGHLAGDQVLIAVAKQLQSVLRGSDTVARLGGDEFAFVLPTVASESPQTVAQKLIDAVALPITLDDGTITVSSSIGIALYPDHGKKNDGLLEKADAAMYEAKRSGGGIKVHNT